MAARRKYDNFITKNKQPIVDTLHFYDSNHMSQVGVEIFNNYFINGIKSEGLAR